MKNTSACDGAVLSANTTWHEGQRLDTVDGDVSLWACLVDSSVTMRCDLTRPDMGTILKTAITTVIVGLTMVTVAGGDLGEIVGETVISTSE